MKAEQEQTTIEQQARRIFERDMRHHEALIQDYCVELAKKKNMSALGDRLMMLSASYEVGAEIVADLIQGKSAPYVHAAILRRIMFVIQDLVPESAGATARAMRVRRLQALQDASETLSKLIATQS
jgi:hypothetical protein